MHTGLDGEFSPPAKVYHISPARFQALVLVYASGFILQCLLITILFVPQTPWAPLSPGWKIYILLFWSLLTIWRIFGFLDRIKIRLATSPAGIAYLGTGYRVFTPWENVEGIGGRRVRADRPGFRQLAGLTLHQPAPVFKRELWACLLVGSGDISPLFIPISDFEGRDGELAGDIRSFVPSLTRLPIEQEERGGQPSSGSQQQPGFPPLQQPLVDQSQAAGQQPYGQVQLQYAGLGLRFLAYGIDVTINSLVDVMIIVVAVALSPNAPGVLGLVSTLLIVLLFFGYFIVLEATRGATLGKMALGLRVVKTNGTPITWSDSLIRNLLRLIDGLFSYLVGAMLIWASPLNQRLGDRAARTVVVIRPRTLPQIW
jgi:uncharacterized RDD family membrane protein YckC